MDNALTPFEGNTIRKIWYDEQWYFAVTDIIEVLVKQTHHVNIGRK